MTPANDIGLHQSPLCLVQPQAPQLLDPPQIKTQQTLVLPSLVPGYLGQLIPPEKGLGEGKGPQLGPVGEDRSQPVEWRHLLDLRVVGQFEQGGEEDLERSLGLWYSILGRGGTAGVLGVAMGLWLRSDLL